MRASQIVPFAVDFPGYPEEVADLEPGYQECLFQANGFDSEVYHCAPCEWNTKNDRRVWRLRAPAYKLNGAPLAFRLSLRKYLVNSAESSPSESVRFEVLPCGTRLYDIFRKSGGAEGAISTRIADNLGGGEPDLLLEARRFLEDDEAG